MYRSFLKKNFKWLTALAVAGTVIGLIIAYFMRKNDEISDFDEDDFDEDDDFDLDGDLKPVSEREYVPLNKAADIAARKAETEAEENGDKARGDASGEKETPAAEESRDQEEAAEEDASEKVQI